MSLTHQEPTDPNSSNSEFDCDVLVVGAGSAGATAAYYLANSGLNVLVLDQARTRVKISDDFLSPGALKELYALGITSTPAVKEAHVIDCATIYLSGEPLASGLFPDVEDLPRYAYVVSRKVLDGLVVKVAMRVGAKVLEGYQVTGYSVDATGVKVNASTSKGTQSFRCRLLIGADGCNSVVAGLLCGESTKKLKAMAARGYFKDVAGLPNEANVFYGADSMPGYSWLFPSGKTEANVGVGIILDAKPQPENPKDLLLKLIQTDAGMKRRLENARLKGDIEVFTFTLPNGSLKLVGNRVLLVGEAAGLANPYNGETLQMALKSGRWAAQTVQSCQGNYSAQALSAYEKQVVNEFGYGFEAGALMLGMLLNRNHTPIGLHWLNMMGEKSRGDPAYARLTSGILSGMIFPNQKETAQAIIGMLETAALSMGVSTVKNILGAPAKLPQAAENLIQTGFAVAEVVIRNPFAALFLGLDATANLAGSAASAAKQTVEDKQKPKTEPQT
ncbi:MAG: geranylgeranyl reductase family protein [Candidatus Bathyarchaeota archaeon]|nr:geranylgeranyl reductase family protein [Candidatus Bathyarchaeota archaeon]